jgi:transposase
MMGRKHREQASLFYEFRLDDMIPKGHLLRRINVFVTSVLGDLHEQLGPFYSAIGRPSIGLREMAKMIGVSHRGDRQGDTDRFLCPSHLVPL